jgi:hypothetical protein
MHPEFRVHPESIPGQSGQKMFGPEISLDPKHFSSDCIRNSGRNPDDPELVPGQSGPKTFGPETHWTQNVLARNKIRNSGCIPDGSEFAKQPDFSTNLSLSLLVVG